MNDYQQLGQPLSQEQIEQQNAANSAAQFFNKTNALGHQPSANQLGQQIKNFGYVEGDEYSAADSSDKLPKPAPQFDSEAHRAFMRGLG
jgi:hypothetical protein